MIEEERRDMSLNKLFPVNSEKALQEAYKYIEEATLHDPIVNAVFKMMQNIDLGESAKYVFLCRYLIEYNKNLRLKLIEIHHKTFTLEDSL